MELGRQPRHRKRDPICFASGSLIATVTGERRVEDLVPGDRVITRDNGIQEIAWIGQKTLSQLGQDLEERFQPILIKAGALGNNLPARDLLVSPNHRLLIANDLTSLLFEDRETLVAAKFLVGRAGVEQLRVQTISYFHLLFERHEVILGNGAWSESFQPGDYAMETLTDDQRSEILALFPELEARAPVAHFASARRSLNRMEASLLR